jgi:NYN domain
MLEEAFLFIDTENIRFYEEDFYWICHQKMRNLIRVFVYVNSLQRTVLHDFYEEMSRKFPITIHNVTTTPHKRNGLDIHMTIDVMNFIASRSSSTIRTVIYIASNDSDFSVLSERLASPPHLLFGRVFHHPMSDNDHSDTIYLSELSLDTRLLVQCFLYRDKTMLTMNQLKKTIRTLNLRRRLTFPLENLVDSLNPDFFHVVIDGGCTRIYCRCLFYE